MLANLGVATTLLLVGLGVCASILPGVPVAVRALLNAPLVLILPGLAWLALIRPTGLELATRLVLSVASTLMLVMVTGLALNWTTEGLSTRAWTFSLALLTLVPVVLRLWLGGPTGDRVRVPARSLLLILPWSIAVMGTVQAYDFAAHSGAERRDDGFTQLWITPDAAGCAGQVQVSLRSYERAPVDLQLTVLVDRQPVVEELWPSVAPGQRIDTPITTGQISGGMVEAQLSRADQPGAPYRWVRLDCGGDDSTARASGEAPRP